jgi:predicted permease
MLPPELWLPVTQHEEVEPAGINDNVPSPVGRTRIERRGSRWLFVKGRLKPGVSAADAHAAIAVLGAQLANAYPETNRARRMSAFPTSSVRLLVPQASGPLSMASIAVMAVVGLVLLIACANVAGMLLARASARMREISVRLAIGASRAHIVRQMLVEGIVLSVLGAVVAVGLAWTLIRLLASVQLPLPASIALDIPLDLRVLVFALIVGLGAGLLAALTPALKASSLRLSPDLRGEIASSRVAGRRWAMRDALVVAQLSLTMVLLVVAGLLLRSLTTSLSADVGFRTSGVAMVSADTNMVRYDAARAEQFWARALERARGIAGVDAAALVSPRLPFDVNFNQTSLLIDGKTYGPDDRGEVVSNVSITPDYFRTLDVPVVEGRAFTDADRQGAPLVAIVNEAMARRFWPNESAVGKTFRLSFGESAKFEVVGVARNYRIHTVNERPTPYLHFAAAQRPSRYYHVVARTGGSATQLVASLRRELLTLEPGLVFINSATMETSMALSLLPDRVAAMLASGFGLIGTLLAAIGLYGVVAFSVARRTREIGVRVAIGADRRDVLRLIMRQGFVLVAVGAAAGVVLAAVLATVLAGILYGVGAFDPIAWGGAFIVLLAAGGAANFIPARRAMRLDPVSALRTE